MAGGFPLSLVNPVFEIMVNEPTQLSLIEKLIQANDSVEMDNFIQEKKIERILVEDIDIFFYDCGSEFKNIQAKVIAIVNCVSKYHEINLQTDVWTKLTDSEHCITLSCASPTKKLYKLQIIKRLYKNIPEILLGFDLSSCACAIIKGSDKKLQIFGLRRWFNALQYNINIINPSRQSRSFNSRIHKYVSKGYFPYIVNAIHNHPSLELFFNFRIDKLDYFACYMETCEYCKGRYEDLQSSLSESKLCSLQLKFHFPGLLLLMGNSRFFCTPSYESS